MGETLIAGMSDELARRWKQKLHDEALKVDETFDNDDEGETFDADSVEIISEEELTQLRCDSFVLQELINTGLVDADTAAQIQLSYR